MRADGRDRLLGLLVAATSLAACDSIMNPTAPGGEWHVEEAGRFTFYVRPGSFAETHVATFADVLADQFTYTVSRLGLQYDGRMTVYLHPSGEDAGFGAGAGADHSGVAYPQTETIKVAAVPPLDGNLFSLMSHETNHVVIHNGLGRPGTSFINEGLASALLSERYHTLGPTFLHRWVAARRAQVPRLADLVNDDMWGTVPQAMAYNASASFLAWLLDQYGPAPLRTIYYASSSGFAAACQSAYGRSLSDLEADWVAWSAGLPP